MMTTTPGHTPPATEDPGAPAPNVLPALQVSPLLAFDLSVAAARPLGANLVRITFTGADLEHFGTGGHPLDLRIKLVVPGPRPTADHFAPVRPGASLDPVDQADWYRRWLQIDPEDRGWLRTYTVRELREAGTADAQLDIDFVLHLEEHATPGSGVAARWARDARSGDTITVLGPNRHVVGPDYNGIEFRPGAARTVLLAGDETAVPAIASVLEALPASVTGCAVVEVPDESDVQQVATVSDVEQIWLVRGERPHGELLSSEVRRRMQQIAQDLAVDGPDGPAAGDGELEDVDVDQVILWDTTEGGDGSFYAWLAGEAGVIKALRRHLVSELGIDRKQVSFMGYWRQGRPEM